MPRLDHAATVARIVAEHAAAAPIFQRHGIDYCCHGDATVPEACRDGRLDPEVVFADLEAAVGAGGAATGDDPRALSTAALVARIVDRHHGYLRRALPRIAPIAAKVAGVHGPRDPRLERLEEAFRDLAGGLAPHLDDEEEVLFPELLARDPDRRVLERELRRMREEHLAVGRSLARVRELAGGFATPEWGCATYRLLMAELRALEADVLAHVHLENHVLAPRFGAPAEPDARPAPGMEAT